MLRLKSNLYVWLCLIAAVAPVASNEVTASPSMSGQSGLVYMPDARIEREGTLQFGISHSEPYTTAWANIAMTPWLEIAGRHIAIDHVPRGAVDGVAEDNDDSLDAKLLLWESRRSGAALAIGGRDLTGSRDFGSQYVVFNKRLGDVDLSIGYGSGRIDGLFGGLRYLPAWNRHLSFVAEYDATDYSDAPFAAVSGASGNEGKETFAVEYRRNWFGSQVSYQDGDVGINAYVTLPLDKSRYQSARDAKDPYTETPKQVSLEEWIADQQYKKRLLSVLNDHGFRVVDVEVNHEEIYLNISHSHISKIGRAVGRAARIGNALGPIEARRLVITYSENDLSLLTYSIDRHMFNRYLAGLISKHQLENHMEIKYPEDTGERVPADEISIELVEADPRFTLFTNNRDTIDWFLGDEFYDGLDFTLLNPGRYLSDANADFRYDIYSRLGYRQRITSGLYVKGALTYRLLDNFDDSHHQPSNSRLPHVRSDVALYKQGSRFKLDSLLVNKFWKPSDRIYTRLSAGIYEEMFGGVGGQLLYLPDEGNWAADVSLDWVRQRGYDGDFDFRDYDTVTSLASLHYQVPEDGLTFTLRAGRFLAEDVGARFELKRRFLSGIEVGFWYTSTDFDDRIVPGSIGDSFHDKGLMVKIPLSWTKGRDSRKSVQLRWSPAVRDVGQMVESPGDLYEMAEERLMLNRHPRERSADLGQ